MKKSFQESILGSSSFVTAESPRGFGPLWTSYRSQDEKLNGWFHFLSPGEALWSISIHDFVMAGDYVMESDPPSYLTVAWFKSVSGEEFSPYRKLKTDCIWGQSIGGGPWRGVVHDTVPVQSVSIEMAPEFAEKYLAREFNGEFHSVEQAFVALGSGDEFPEMRALLSKLWPQPGDAYRNELYYEGKVLEAMGLIVERSRHVQLRETRPLSPVDRERIHDVVRYIDDHCSADLRISDLASIACMSPTKFKETFKRANGKTLTQYVQERRMSRAEMLLRQPDLTIEQVGRAVGYTCASRFSALFKRETGMLPSEFRRTLRP